MNANCNSGVISIFSQALAPLVLEIPNFYTF